MILVSRCTEPEAVPSNVVQCSICGEDCWLSKYSGQSTIALAKSTGDDRFVCSECLITILLPYRYVHELDPVIE